MVFNDTFNNISETNWNIVESVLKHHNSNPLKQTEILLLVSLNTITLTLYNKLKYCWQFNDTFNNISVCFRGLGLCYLTRLSTIFQFVIEG
jgi:hypothetical protein